MHGCDDLVRVENDEGEKSGHGNESVANSGNAFQPAVGQAEPFDLVALVLVER